MRASAAQKARTYLTEGRLILRRVDGPHVIAYCRGDGALYRIEVHHDHGTCTCPARGRCSHLLAVGLVTATIRKEHP
jgi:uncharacterized Zn finger protein